MGRAASHVRLLSERSLKVREDRAKLRPEARLALRLARRVRTTQGFRNRLMGYALLHLAEALRREIDLHAAHLSGGSAHYRDRPAHF